MLQETKNYRSKYGIGSQWTINGHSFYTIEFDDCEYIDLYEHEASWLEALKTGENNESRIDSIPNVFKNDDCEDTFYIYAAIFGGCGSITKTKQILNGVFEMCEDGYIYPKNFQHCTNHQKLSNENEWIEIA